MELFGVRKSKLILSSVNGWHGVKKYMRDAWGVDVDNATAQVIAARFKDRAHLINAENPPNAVLMEAAREYNVGQGAERQTA